MTTIPNDTLDRTQQWKWIAIALAALLAILLLVVAMQSYRLDHTPHPSGRLPAGLMLAPSDDAVTPPDPLTGVNPWNELSRLHQQMRQMDQLFDAALGPDTLENPAAFPAVSIPNLDVREEKDHYTVRADMPGADKDTVKVNVEGRLLTISGERTSVNETKDADKVVRSERSMAQFVRTIELPGPVNAASVDAKYDNGVLTLTLPKAAPTGTGTQVPVHS